MQIRIITDDFTSATDGLPAFAQRGWTTAVALSHQASLQAQVISTDTDSRTLSAEQAVFKVTAWANEWQAADILVKQFDSTLRGPLVAEVIAAQQASGRKKILIAPAFPEAGRTTVQGCVLVHDVPVHQTSFANDPLNPVNISSLPALFATAGVTLQVARNPEHTIDLLEHFDAVVMDASDEHALQDIAAMAWARRELLWAGSTGLLRALAQSLPERFARGIVFAPAKQPAIVVGSQNPRSRLQKQFTEKSHTLIFATPDVAGDPVQLTDALAKQVSESVKQGQCDGLIVTGGETAKHIARLLQASEIRVLREVEAGIPLCVMQTPYGALPLITKAGGFGDDNTFNRCLQVIQGTAQ
jgi:D-threonate/D-erythronate kinase